MAITQHLGLFLLDLLCCVCSIREQNKTGKKADPTWCISFNFVDLKHKDVFATCGGVRVCVRVSQLLLLFAVLCAQSLHFSLNIHQLTIFIMHYPLDAAKAL